MISLQLVTVSYAQDSVSEIHSLQDLKSLEQEIKSVVAKVQPATVSLAANRTGAWGSGVVVSEDGLILTAAHVVQGTPEMIVIFPDGTEKEGKVLGANRTKDIAMVQITQPGSYPFAKTGNSDELKVGNFVVAMGHAGGYDTLRKPPVRFGRIVSRNPNGFISSDCTLIGGDSGGPLFDMKGNVVGINSSIGYDFKANNHAGISGLLADWDRLKKGDTWGDLRANPLANPDSPVMGFSIGGELDGGIMAEAILPDGPADLAGMKPNDVIRAINGQRVKSGKALLIELNRYRPGQTIKVRVKRGNESRDLDLKLVKRGDFYTE
ncbi:putative serine protease HhoA [Rubritalea halochordaticola]|uniref:Serine protease HhoA n=1 Tax=Rubritalea halochordaticola TaxID=714537 RepID=A0ABP9V0D2_9BACT